MVTIATKYGPAAAPDIVPAANIEKPVAAVRDAALDPARHEARIAALREAWQKVHDEVIAAGGPHHHRHRAPRVAPYNQRQAVAAPGARATRARAASSFPPRRSSADEDLRRRAPERDHGPPEDARRVRRDRARDGDAPWSRRAGKASSSATSTSGVVAEYDDVANDQRRSTSAAKSRRERRGDIPPTPCARMRQGVLHDIFRRYVPVDSVEEGVACVEQALLAECQPPMWRPAWRRLSPVPDDEAILPSA